MASANHYSYCGLAIASELAIPGLPAGAPNEPCDVRILIGQGTRARDAVPGECLRYMSPERDGEGSPHLMMWSGSSGHRLRYNDGTEFAIDPRATRVEVHWEDPLTESDAAVYLLGPVLGFVIRLRGIVPLHASAVLIGTGAVAFLGDAWAGKSTTAAAFAMLGFSVLSDDLLPLMEVANRTLVCPSHPRLSVWPDSARALFAHCADLPRLSPTYDKRYLDLRDADRFQRTPVPLKMICVLGDRTSTQQAFQIDSIRPQAALLSLVGNTYGNYLLDSSMRALEFDVLSRVVQRIPVRRLSFAGDIAQLPAACRMLADGNFTEAEPSL